MTVENDEVVHRRAAADRIVAVTVEVEVTVAKSGIAGGPNPPENVQADAVAEQVRVA